MFEVTQIFTNISITLKMVATTYQINVHPIRRHNEIVFMTGEFLSKIKNENKIKTEEILQ